MSCKCKYKCNRVGARAIKFGDWELWGMIDWLRERAMKLRLCEIEEARGRGAYVGEADRWRGK
jgi:hypothetical protein